MQFILFEYPSQAQGYPFRSLFATRALKC
jgi:hypothetical protein